MYLLKYGKCLRQVKRDNLNHSDRSVGQYVYMKSDYIHNSTTLQLDLFVCTSLHLEESIKLQGCVSD